MLLTKTSTGAAWALLTIGLLVMPAVAQDMPAAKSVESGRDNKPTPSRLAAARELLELTGSAKQFDAVLPLMINQMRGAFVSQRPDKRGDIEKSFELAATEMLKRKAELIDQIAEIYAKAMTEEDLAGIIAFYKSPVGKHFVEALPKLTQESMLAGQRWGQSVGVEIQNQVRDELKKRGIDL